MRIATALKPVLTATVLSLAAALAPGAAHAEKGTNIGRLDCKIDGGIGLLIGSKKEVNCSFSPSSGPTETYRGSITKLGVDIGYTKKSYVTWLVFAPGKVKPGALAGRYGGATAEATIGAGLGANVLVGGLKNSIALQPLSVQGQSGLNLAAGIAGLRLKFKN